MRPCLYITSSALKKRTCKQTYTSRHILQRPEHTRQLLGTAAPLEGALPPSVIGWCASSCEIRNKRPKCVIMEILLPQNAWFGLRNQDCTTRRCCRTVPVSQAHPRRVARVSSQIQQEIGDMFVSDPVREGSQNRAQSDRTDGRREWGGLGLWSSEMRCAWGRAGMVDWGGDSMGRGSGSGMVIVGWQGAGDVWCSGWARGKVGAGRGLTW